MFQTIQEPTKKSRKSTADLSRQLWQNRWLRYGVAAALVLSIGSGLYSYSLWQQSISIDCDRYAAPEIEVAEIIALKERLAAYQHDRSEEAYLSLSAEELGVVIYTATEICGEYGFGPEGLAAQLTVPRPDGSCYHVDFVGQIESRRGSIEIRPNRMVIGTLDVTSWFQPSYTVDAARFGETAEQTFSNITSISVTATEAQIRLRNRKKIW
jgi:hypothetical protein